MRVATLVDTTLCMGCRACQVACKQWNELKAVKTDFRGTYENPPSLSARTWTKIKFFESDNGGPAWRFRKQQCMHCENASCVAVCPTGAAKKLEDGTVIIEQSVCAGCKYCVEVCPFQTPKFDEEAGTAIKCRFCYDRVGNGLKPACVKACPTGALTFGPRDEIVAEAKRRADARPDLTVYGVDELGGLNWIYLLDREPEDVRLPKDPQLPTARIYLKWLSGVIPGLAILGGLAWLFRRKTELAEKAVGAKDKA